MIDYQFRKRLRAAAQEIIDNNVFLQAFEQGDRDIVLEHFLQYLDDREDCEYEESIYARWLSYTLEDNISAWAEMIETVRRRNLADYSETPVEFKEKLRRKTRRNDGPTSARDVYNQVQSVAELRKTSMSTLGVLDW